MSDRSLKKDAEPDGESEKPATRIDIERVLQIAAEQFAEHGFDGVSMREVARDCGYPLASIYYHFTSKTNLYTEAYSHKIEQTIDLMAFKLDAIVDARERFGTMVRAFYDLFTSDHVLLLLMQRDVIDSAVSRRRFLSKRVYDHFNAMIRRMAGECAGVDVSRETAFIIGATIFGYCELSRMTQEIYDISGPEVARDERERLVRATTAMIGVG